MPDSSSGKTDWLTDWPPPSSLVPLQYSGRVGLTLSTLISGLSWAELSRSRVVWPTLSIMPEINPAWPDPVYFISSLSSEDRAGWQGGRVGPGWFLWLFWLSDVSLGHVEERRGEEREVFSLIGTNDILRCVGDLTLAPPQKQNNNLHGTK